jgi:glyoxylate reductase
MKVVVSRLIPPEGIALLEQQEYALEYHDSAEPLPYQDLLDLTKDADALLCFLDDTIDQTFIDSCPKLKIISNYAVGYNNIDLSAANHKRVYVGNTPGVLTDATADLTWALILTVTRNVLQGHQYVIDGKFHVWGSTLLRGLELSGKTLGILGAGRIGTAVAIRAKAFGMSINYYDRGKKSELDVIGCKFKDIDDIIQTSDVLTLHLPFTEETHHLMNQERLHAMKQGSFIVNTSRGKLVQEDALVAALRTGPIAGAGLDVYEDEPSIHPGLLQLDNVVLLPHIGSATYHARKMMSIIAAENIIDVLSGRDPKHWANRKFSS